MAHRLRSFAEADVLPPYSAVGAANSSRAAGQPTHTFQLRKGSGKPWLSLLLQSGAKSDQAPPYFQESEPIQGWVQLDLDKPEYLLEINLLITGDLSPSTEFGSKNVEGMYSGRRVFLQLKTTVWQASNTSSPSLMDRMRRREGDRMDGRHEFPFSIDLPKTFSHMCRDYPLPASFAETGAWADVAYNMKLEVKRGILAEDNEINIGVRYCPLVIPGPFSILRRNAYEKDSKDLVGPEGDPEGWKTFKPTVIRGELFGSRLVEVAATLSLANPVSYTRGSVIPCIIDVSTSDTQALDLLSSPAAQVVRLVCSIVYMDVQKDTVKEGNQSTAPATYSRVIQSAVWWPAPASVAPKPRRAGLPPVRRLHGEIHLSAELKPAIDVPDFRLSYHIGLFPFSAAGFAPSKPRAATDHGSSAKAADCLCLPPIPIEIATAFAPGTRPRVSTRVSYDKGTEWDSQDAAGRNGMIPMTTRNQL